MSVAIFDRSETVSAPAARSRTSIWRGARYVVEVFDGADDALDALEAIQGGLNRGGALASTGFQTLNWLTVLYEELAPAKRAMPRVVVVTDRNSREVVLVLPLVIYRKRRLRLARFADLGISDYGAPILGPAMAIDRKAMRRVWRAVRHALRDVDLIRLENMPFDIAGRHNLLAVCAGTAPSRRSGTILEVTGSVDDYLQSLGRKYREEVERCTRLWLKERAPRFARAMRPDEIARAFTVLDEQQRLRSAARGDKHRLGTLDYRQFFERLVMDGSEVGLCHLFTLEADGEIIATLLAIQHEGTATLIRMSHAGDEWKALSPGRLICVEALRYFVDRGVRRFDLGRGESEFKTGFGAASVPLFDLIIARRLAGAPRAAFHRVKGRARQSQRLRAVAHSFARLFARA